MQSDSIRDLTVCHILAPTNAPFDPINPPFRDDRLGKTKSSAELFLSGDPLTGRTLRLDIGFGVRGARPRASAWAVVALVLLLGGCEFFINPREKATAYLAKGDLAAVRRIEATNAIQADETDAEARLLLGRVLLAQGELITAERTLGKAAALGIDPNRVDGLRARVMLKSRAYARIIEEIKPTPAHQGEVLGWCSPPAGRRSSR